MKIDLNGTRVAAQQNLYLSLLIMARAIQMRVSDINLHREERPAKMTDAVLELRDSDWDTLAETEGVLNVVRWATTVSQLETAFTGGYRPAVEMRVERLLSPYGEESGVDVIDWRRVTPEHTASSLPRVRVLLNNLTPIGSQLLMRGFEEAKTRHSMIQPTATEMAAVMLDPRLCYAKNEYHDDERALGMALLEELFVKFNMVPLHKASKGEVQWRTCAACSLTRAYGCPCACVALTLYLPPPQSACPVFARNMARNMAPPLLIRPLIRLQLAFNSRRRLSSAGQRQRP